MPGKPVAEAKPITRGMPVRTTFKIVSYAVIALMAAGIIYANAIGIAYWTGIGV